MESPTEKPKILIVDDMPANLRVLNAILMESCTLFVTSNSLKALEKARTHRPDLILLDIMMPEMDGYAVCQQLKEEAETRDIPIMFITAMTGEEDEIRGFEVGAVDYISKPFKPTVVLARVKTHLALRAMQKALQEQNAALLEADRLKADVERIMRHDLKAPITSMVGCADLILTASTWSLPPDLRRFVQMIHDAGRNALHMVSLSLDLYKMEQGRYPLEPTLVDLVPLLTRLIQENVTEIRNKEMAIHTRLEGQPLAEGERFVVFGEEILCYSLFSNLFKNALEAAPAHTPLLLSLERQQGEARIAIHNAGAVPAEIQHRFFEKYVTSGKRAGTGLGTYSARLMTEVQKGRIGMESSEEHGTTVTVHLPLLPDL
ncbi:MAG: hybrid sensor histidine kinase/response regulator [Magnetococcales bacterium]|nr:hybrid sensor histidine kinase/response regulator [Magnetococcales bacterium]